MIKNFADADASIAVYIHSPLQGAPLFFLVDRILNKGAEVEKNLWNFFQGSDGEASLDFLHVTEDPAHADLFLLPHNYFSLGATRGDARDKYVNHFVALAQKHNKKILVFAMADSDEHVNIPNSFIFRYSQYGYKKRENEIMIPPYSLHFRNAQLMEYRKKVWGSIFLREKSEKPVVSFCGWADFPNTFRRITYGIRVMLTYLKKYVFQNKYSILHLHGIYWRRKAMGALKNSKLINTHFLLRKSFSTQKGLDGTRRVDPEIAEKEYIENIINADFVLAPKGHANESVRFYEALSLGRFPVLINTDKVLPLEGYIDYSKIMVTVDYFRVHKLEQAIIDFYNSLNEKEFIRRQKMAREAFELLRPGSFLKIVLSELKPKH